MTHDDLIALDIPEETADAIMKMHASEMKAAADELAARHNEEFFNHLLDEELTKERALNFTAAKALLNMDHLKAAENREEAIRKAVSDLHKSADFLFQPPAPPPYAAGTGSMPILFRYSDQESAFREAIGVNSRSVY